MEIKKSGKMQACVKTGATLRWILYSLLSSLRIFSTCFLFELAVVVFFQASVCKRRPSQTVGESTQLLGVSRS